MSETFPFLNRLRLADCEIHLRSEVLRSPSLFGRLVAIASLREQWQEFTKRLGAERLLVAEVDRAVRKLQIEVFSTWMTLTLKQQESDLALYLATDDAERPPIQALPALIHRLVPPQALAVEDDLFAMDLALVAPAVHAVLQRAALSLCPVSEVCVGAPAVSTPEWTPPGVTHAIRPATATFRLGFIRGALVARLKSVFSLFSALNLCV
jgi:hypothetical protein